MQKQMENQRMGDDSAPQSCCSLKKKRQPMSSHDCLNKSRHSRSYNLLKLREETSGLPRR